MEEKKKKEFIQNFRSWIIDNLLENHRKNTVKLTDINKFKINPFTLYYLSYFKEGNDDPKSLAKVLIYPRILGTSLSTSFGGIMQRFIVEHTDAEGATSPGFDIKFKDKLDNDRYKYCQLKAGPNSINKDDVDTIDSHFSTLRGICRQNNIPLNTTDMVFGVMYGSIEERNSFIVKLEDEKNYPVFIGKEFWHRLTGDPNMYKDLILEMKNIALDTNMKDVIENVIEKLSVKIDDRFKKMLNE